MAKKKLYTPEELELNKFYMRGDNTAMMLLEKTGKVIESYPGAYSNVYRFKTISLGESVIETEREIPMNPTYKGFSNIKKAQVIKLLHYKQKEMKCLMKIINK